MSKWNFLQGWQNLPPLLALCCFCIFYCFLRFSPYGDLRAFLNRPLSTRFYDRHGSLVQIVPLENGLRREYVDIETIPPALIAVFLNAEDERFYGHIGVDPLPVLRAAYQNIRAGRRVSGASTVTMQLARIIAASGAGGNAAVSRRRNIAAKIAETFNALRLEARFSKKEILSLYLNSIPFGFQTEGIASAARNFFAKDPGSLSPAETFCLAVIPRRPAAYNPLTERAASVDAARKLAERFAENPRNAAAFPFHASLTDDDWEALRPGRFLYPHFMEHLVRHVIRNTFFDEAGTTGRNASRPADYTLSADLEIQRLAEDLLASGLHRAVSSRLNNGAAIVIDHRSGEVLAWAAVSNTASTRNTVYGGETGSGIDGVLVRNQMGSSMKPFLYALALERGYRPATVLADIPSRYGGAEVYIPRNFNNRFNGPVLLRTALASSLNIPAVDILDHLGIGTYADFLSTLGFAISAEEAEKAGLGLALGNAPVNLAELAAAFSIFPRDGKKLALRFDRVERNGGAAGGTEDQVMDADTARIICSILSDRRARRLGFGRGSNFETPFPAIFKTGTANQYQNIAALGAGTRFTAAVWMGNFSGETVVGRTGSSLPASIVRSLLVRLQGANAAGGAFPAGVVSGSFKEPDTWEKVPLCALSGMAPSAACPSVIEEYQPRYEDNPVCTWHEDRGGRQAVRYPPEYQNWFLSLSREGEMDYSAAALEITNPRDNYAFLASPGRNGSIPVEVIGGGEDMLEVDYSGETFTISRPFVFFLPYRPGSHTLTVRCGEESDTVRFSAQ